jgi:micrococcal nuclease
MKRHLPTAAALLVITAAAAAQTAAPKPATAPAQTHKVLRVIDGDTVVVQMPGGAEHCRLIGVDAPELHPANKSLGILGQRSAEFLRRLVEGKQVRVSYEPGATNRDRYRRLLVYLHLGETFVNREIIAKGFANVYSRVPFTHLEDFRAAARRAREQRLGLWAQAPEKPPRAEATTRTQPKPDNEDVTVYITRTGAKYHRAGCRALAKSSIAVSLATAREKQGPCSICHPPE